jgi:hypothetical protein
LREAEARVSLVLQSENKFANWLKRRVRQLLLLFGQAECGWAEIGRKMRGIWFGGAASAAGILKAPRHITSIVLMAIQEPLAGIKVCGRPNFLHHKHHFKRFLSLSLSLVRKKWLCTIILRSRSILPAQLFKNHFGQQALMAICNAFADATFARFAR